MPKTQSGFGGRTAQRASSRFKPSWLSIEQAGNGSSWAQTTRRRAGQRCGGCATFAIELRRSQCGHSETAPDVKIQR